MIFKASKFVGFAVAFVASTFASSPPALAQAKSGRALSPEAVAVVLNTVTRSTVSGVVRDRAGQPQIGTLVELLNTQYGIVARTFTDDRGRYSLPQLGAGMYQLKASNSLFLPTVRPDLRLLANTKVIVNLTLSNLYQALQWLPVQPRDASSAEDDWNWTLRLSTNRPLLRVLDSKAVQTATRRARQYPSVPYSSASESSMPESSMEEPTLIEQEVESKTSPIQEIATRRIVVRNGFTQFGEGGLQQQVTWRSNDNETRAFLLEAQTAFEAQEVGRISALAAYKQELSPDHSLTTVLTLSDRPLIRAGTQDGLVSMHLRSASTIRLGDLADVSAGMELAAARLGDHSPVMASHPFATVAVHAGNTAVQYRAASAPTMRDADTLQRQAAEDTLALTEQDGQLHMEEGLHQELRISRKVGTRKVGTWTGELSAFHDTLDHPVVEGAVSSGQKGMNRGDLLGDVLYDPGTGTIAISGQRYSHGGVMGLLHDQLSPDTWISFQYAMGEAATMARVPAAGTPPAQSVSSPSSLFAVRPTSMIGISAGAHVPVSGTLVHGSYRWQPSDTLTAVAPFDGGTPDAYLSFSLRQPLHFERIGMGKLEAILDVRNLLAQGYHPFLSRDGTMVYFAQAQRCIAGGVSFSF